VSEHFAPPPDEEPTRARSRLCRAAGPDGERCYLYFDHEAEYHWDGKVKWLDANPA
jgi:hypothetical protein